MTRFLLTAATIALVAPGVAFAQSTGSQEVEEEIVVTGSRTSNGVEGIVTPEGTKARGVLTQEFIARQSPGQSILNAINVLPGVNFVNNDPYGSSGGNVRIRGFDGNRISLTFDGLPLNDTGNYAIFSNQQLDPELIEEVNVNLGATDIDSPTASAAGGTINYRTIIPGRSLAPRATASIGEDSYTRIFGLLDLGTITPFGTRAFVSASTARNDKFKGPGRIRKQQYNARLYQEIGGGDDFISIAGHYNQNRNNFYRNPSINDLRTLAVGQGITVPANTTFTSASPLVIGGFGEGFNSAIFNFENDRFCANTTLTNGTAGRPNVASPSCTSYFNLRVNPSNTGNVRANSRFTLSDRLVLTIDPSIQFVQANGGGFTTLAENAPRVRSGLTAAGVDYNGDGDVLDTVQFYTPNNTRTRRIGLTSSLIFDVTDEHRLRVAYTYDRGRHRQTGEWGFLDPATGNPDSVFGGLEGTPVLDAAGNQIQQRDRLSFAILNQISGQYIGRFFDRRLRVEAGLRAPFFKRELETFCPIEARGGGFAFCTSQPLSELRIIGPNDAVPATGATPYYAPYSANYKYDDVLPNFGASFDVMDGLNIFGSYAKGFSAPRTDNLYRAPFVRVAPETTDSFDLGLRYTTRNIQAQVTGFVINYQNRIVSSFNPDLGISLDRNVGEVKSRGVDGSIAVRPVRGLTLYGFASYIDAKLQENVQTGAIAAGVSCGTSRTAVPAGCAATAGKFVVETPEYQYGGRFEFDLGGVEIGATGKYVGDRFATDTNDVRVEDYFTVDLDASYSLRSLGLENTKIQLNVVNLFDKFYFGNISTQINAAGNPNFTVGAPRTVLGSIQFGF